MLKPNQTTVRQAVATIETERTLIRPFTINDAEDLFAIDRLESVMKTVSWPAKNLQESQIYIQSGPLVQYQQHGFGRMAIIDKESQRFIGVTGLKIIPEFDEIDIAYRLLPNFWGRGLATEVAKKVIEHGLNELGLAKIIGMAFPQNQRSIHILKKIGMTYEKNVFFWGKECVLYSIAKSTSPP